MDNKMYVHSIIGAAFAGLQVYNYVNQAKIRSKIKR